MPRDTSRNSLPKRPIEKRPCPTVDSDYRHVETPDGRLHGLTLSHPHTSPYLMRHRHSRFLGSIRPFGLLTSLAICHEAYPLSPAIRSRSVSQITPKRGKRSVRINHLVRISLTMDVRLPDPSLSLIRIRALSGDSVGSAIFQGSILEVLGMLFPDFSNGLIEPTQVSPHGPFSNLDLGCRDRIEYSPMILQEIGSLACLTKAQHT